MSATPTVRTPSDSFLASVAGRYPWIFAMSRPWVAFVATDEGWVGDAVSTDTRDEAVRCFDPADDDIVAEGLSVYVVEASRVGDLWAYCTIRRAYSHCWYVGARAASARQVRQAAAARADEDRRVAQRLRMAGVTR